MSDRGTGDNTPENNAPDSTDAQAPETPSATPTETSGTSGEPSSESRQWAMFTHLSALVGFLIPFGNLIAPLIMWQVKKDDPFIDSQGKEALNFQLTVSIAGIIAAVLTIILIGLLLLPIIAIGSLILVIMAGIKANDGEDYEYPFAIRLIK